MRRSVNLKAFPRVKVVLQFDLRGLTKGKQKKRSYWMVVEAERVDVCFQDPGFGVAVVIGAELSAFTHVVMSWSFE